jgi:hypothetical protein
MAMPIADGEYFARRDLPIAAQTHKRRANMAFDAPLNVCF